MKDRLLKLLAVIGALALVGAVGGAIVGLQMLGSGLSARPDPPELEAKLALTARRKAVPARYRELKNPVTLDANRLRGAMEHWADHCAICHANDGSGSEMGRMMYPRAPDMRAPRTQELTDGELYWAINQGVRLTGMPAWGKSGDDDQGSWELVAFIRQLPQLTPAQLEEMKGMNPVPASALKLKQEEDDFLNGTDAHEGHH